MPDNRAQDKINNKKMHILRVCILRICLLAVMPILLLSCCTKKMPVDSFEPENNSIQSEDSKTDSTVSGDEDGESSDKTDYLIIVDRNHKLPDEWEDNLKIKEDVNSVGDIVRAEATTFDAYQDLKEALKDEGIHIEMDSAYRSVAEQQEIIDEFTEKYGADYASSYVSTPGYSEHHTGLAVDLYLIVDGKTVYENEDLVQYPEIWEKIHARLADYGFILRYPKGSPEGYAYEPWHIRYVGKDAAKEIHEHNLTLEQYLRSKE